MKTSESRGKIYRLSRAFFKFIHNTKDCERNHIKIGGNSLDIVKDSSEENATIKKESSLSQKPLMYQSSSNSSSDQDDKENETSLVNEQNVIFN